LEITGENLLKTHHPKIFIGKIATYSKNQVVSILERFQSAVDQNDNVEIRRLFNEILPEASITVDVPIPAEVVLIEGARPLSHSSKLGLADSTNS
jgi:hypothetical protein